MGKSKSQVVTRRFLTTLITDNQSMIRTAFATAAKIIDRAGSRLIAVTFVKKDGSERNLVFNPKDHNDIKGTGTPCSNPNIFRVRETSKGQWRSFDCTRLIRIKVGGEVIS